MRGTAVLFTQHRRETYAPNTATPTRLLAGLLDRTPADMVADLIAGEEPTLGSVHSHKSSPNGAAVEITALPHVILLSAL